jgi:hypothetical protein
MATHFPGFAQAQCSGGKLVWNAQTHPLSEIMSFSDTFRYRPQLETLWHKYFNLSNNKECIWRYSSNESIKRITTIRSLRRVWRYQREVIRIRISEKKGQHNGQKKKYKRTNNDLQNIHIKYGLPSRQIEVIDLYFNANFSSTSAMS